MKLLCYFHGTVFHSTPAHQKHTPAWGAIVSSGYALFLLQIKSVCSADSSTEKISSSGQTLSTCLYFY